MGLVGEVVGVGVVDSRSSGECDGRRGIRGRKDRRRQGLWGTGRSARAGGGAKSAVCISCGEGVGGTGPGDPARLTI